MLKARQHAGFFGHPFRRMSVGVVNVQNLEGHATIELFIATNINGAHATAANLTEPLVSSRAEVGLHDGLAQVIDDLIRQISHFRPRPPGSAALHCGSPCQWRWTCECVQEPSAGGGAAWTRDNLWPPFR